MTQDKRFTPGTVLLSPDVLIAPPRVLNGKQFNDTLISGLGRFIETITLHESIAYFRGPTTYFDESFWKNISENLEFCKGYKRGESFDFSEDTYLAFLDWWRRSLKNATEEQIRYTTDWWLNTILVIWFSCTRGLSIRTGDISTLSYILQTCFKAHANEIVHKDIKDKIISETMRAVNNKNAELNSLLPNDRFTLDVPLVLNYVLDKAHKREDIIPIALDVRDSKEARAFRKQLALLDEATMVGDDKLLIPLIEEIRDKIDGLGKKLAQPSLGLQIGYPLSIALTPSGIWERLKSRRRRHLIFIEQLYEAGIRARSIHTQLGKLV